MFYQVDFPWRKALRLPELYSHSHLFSPDPLAMPDPRIEEWRTSSPLARYPRLLEIRWANAINRATKRKSSKQLEWLSDLEALSLDAVLPDTDGTVESLLRIAVNPFVRLGRRKLHIDLRNTYFEPYLEDVLAIYKGRLKQMVLRPLLLEMKLSRLRGDFQSTSPEDTLRQFTRLLCTPDRLWEFYRSYPVLVRSLLEHHRNRLAFISEFVERFEQDSADVLELLGQQEFGSLRGISAHGDLHAGQRQVLHLHFERGSVIYKPRSIQAEAGFYRIAEWMNSQGFSVPLRPLRLIDRQSYGWVEWIDHIPCTTEADHHRFYRRYGGLLALLYVLGTTDQHFENVIAHGEFPMLVDLETLMSPRRAADIDEVTFENTVLRTGILPNRVLSKTDFRGVDLSAIGTLHDQLIPYTAVHLQNSGPDVEIVRKPQHILKGKNQPSEGVEPAKYLRYLTEGFTEAYRLISKERAQFLKPGGLLDGLAQVPIRVLLRSTATYQQLANDTFHPDHLRDALMLDCFLDNLWMLVQLRPEMAEVAPLEYDDLAANDIPLFYTYPNSRDVLALRGGRIEGFFHASAMDVTRGRIQSMGETDLRRQLYLLKASMAQLGAKEVGYSPTGPEVADPIALASGVASRIADLAYHYQGEATWVSTVLAPSRGWFMAPCSCDLYSGAAGITLFLAYLSRYHPVHRELAQAAALRLRTWWRKNGSRLRLTGGFSGWGGLIYTFSHLATLWSDKSYLDEAEAMVQPLLACLEEDDYFDLVAGSAGAIMGLRTLLRVRYSDRVLEAMVRCGEHLERHAVAQRVGVGWPERGTAVALAGLAHGTSGIAMALSQLGVLAGEPRFTHLAQRALEYERHLFVPERGNWLDLRGSADESRLVDGKGRSFMSAWCHGSIGIGLSRLRMPIADPIFKSEVRAAVQEATEFAYVRDHSLCHGTSGVVELLLEASRSDASYRRELQQYVEGVNRGLISGLRCGLPFPAETLGLMNGLAGIGYSALRLAYPEEVPSLLLLDPPL